jgi:choline monooxygenase
MVEIDENIAAAETPPGAAYFDPEMFRREVDRIFTSAWLGLSPRNLPPRYIEPIELLPGALDEPLLLATDSEGVLRCLSNACTHRGMKLASESGPAKRIRCGYHGRRFAMDGRLEVAPGFEGAENFPRPSDDLKRAQIGQWASVPFVQVQSGQSFADWIAPLSPWLDFLPLDELRFDPSATRRFSIEANWKLYLDNYLEGFHIPTVHRSLAAVLNVGEYRIERLRGGSLQIGIAAEGEPVLPLGDSHPLRGQSVGALYFHLFPNTLFNVYPWGVSMNHVNPKGPTETEVIFERLVWKPGLLEQGAGADLDRVEMEDEAVVEATQKGLRSRLYDRGRYAPKHEAAVHHFHRWWSDRIR